MLVSWAFTMDHAHKHRWAESASEITYETCPLFEFRRFRRFPDVIASHLEKREVYSNASQGRCGVLGGKGLRRRPLFLAIRHGQLFVEMQMGPVTFEMRVDAEFDGVVGGG